ncbi:MAG: 23S rRNA pseudouridine(1911/1915/1917) synthase RluD [Pseudomonadota bacterium]
MSAPKSTPDRLCVSLPDTASGERLDVVLAGLSGLSRSQVQRLIRQGEVILDGVVADRKVRVLGGERVELPVGSDVALDEEADAAVKLQVVHQDADLFVIDKPAGLVMHPAPGAPRGTVLNGLLALDPALRTLPRAGIVHRLDKDTTGLFVVARSARAFASLTEQLQARTVRRRYQAVVVGTPVAGGTVDAPIGRHPVDRKRMAVRAGGRPAVTHYRVAERFRAHTVLDVSLETGRTHQIRVHMAHQRLPLVGDPVYGGRLRVPAGASTELIDRLRDFPRQALHAVELSLVHPADAATHSWQSALPDDMRRLVDALAADTAVHR